MLMQIFDTRIVCVEGSRQRVDFVPWNAPVLLAYVGINLFVAQVDLDVVDLEVACEDVAVVSEDVAAFGRDGVYARQLLFGTAVPVRCLDHRGTEQLSEHDDAENTNSTVMTPYRIRICRLLFPAIAGCYEFVAFAVGGVCVQLSVISYGGCSLKFKRESFFMNQSLHLGFADERHVEGFLLQLAAFGSLQFGGE